jgi:glycosyltransferase involved in cell wall biosynthesis
MEQKPLISVIIPTYNRQNYVTEAIESVLSQDHQPIELIVVDDGSTDGTDRAVSLYGAAVRYHWQPNQGVSIARNKGIALAQADYLAFLDSDDLWMPNKLTEQMRAFDNDPQVEAVFCHVRQFFSPEVPTESRAKIWCPDEAVPGYLPSSMLIKRDAFNRIGQFEPELRTGESMSWMIRSQESGLRLIMLPDCLCLRRIHAANKGFTNQKSVGQRAAILKAMLERKRQMASVDQEDRK